MPDSSNKELRALKVKQRDRLTDKELASAQNKLAKNAENLAVLQTAKRVLSYLPMAGEISPATLISQLAKATIYLPRITDYKKHIMEFFPAENPRQKNRFHIEEPTARGSPICVRELDVVIVPLVLFDRSGSRVGMGGGYYDRAFSFRLSESTTYKPRLIGVAHGFQEVDFLRRKPWDVPMDVIITDRELIEAG